MAQEFSAAILGIKEILEAGVGRELIGSRLKNQADFYSLFCAIVELQRNNQKVEPTKAAAALLDFVNTIEDGEERAKSPSASSYYEAARSASNDAGPRRKRIDTLKGLIA